MHYKDYHEDILLAKYFTLKVLKHLRLPSLDSILDMLQLFHLVEVKGLG